MATRYQRESNLPPEIRMIDPTPAESDPVWWEDYLNKKPLDTQKRLVYLIRIFNGDVEGTAARLSWTKSTLLKYLGHPPVQDMIQAFCLNIDPCATIEDEERAREQHDKKTLYKGEIDKLVADKMERLRYWAHTALNLKYNIKERMKAMDCLCKASCDYSEKIIHEENITLKSAMEDLSKPMPINRLHTDKNAFLS